MGSVLKSSIGILAGAYGGRIQMQRGPGKIEMALDPNGDNQQCSGLSVTLSLAGARKRQWAFHELCWRWFSQTAALLLSVKLSVSDSVSRGCRKSAGGSREETSSNACGLSVNLFLSGLGFL